MQKDEEMYSYQVQRIYEEARLNTYDRMHSATNESKLEVGILIVALPNLKTSPKAGMDVLINPTVAVTQVRTRETCPVIIKKIEQKLILHRRAAVLVVDFL